MPIDLTIDNAVSSTLQVVEDQNGSPTALSLAKSGAKVKGQDVVGAMLPFTVDGEPVGAGQQTWGRLVRLQGMGAQFYDIGIDTSGNLFLNGPNSTQTNHLITITPAGVITFGK